MGNFCGKQTVSFIGVPWYPKVEHSYETFGKLRCLKAKKKSLLIYMKIFGPQTQTSMHTQCLYFIHSHGNAYVQFYTKHNTFMSSPSLLWYLRTHLANRGTEQMEMKHRCSQAQIKALAAWCWDPECSSFRCKTDLNAILTSLFS